MSKEDRQAMIQTLVEYTQINQGYYESLSDERLIQEYDRIISGW